VPVSATLDVALAHTLQSDDGRVAVVDGERYLGDFTAATVYATLRRSVRDPAVQ
jgi:hypothetical protein